MMPKIPAYILLGADNLPIDVGECGWLVSNSREHLMSMLDVESPSQTIVPIQIIYTAPKVEIVSTGRTGPRGPLHPGRHRAETLTDYWRRMGKK